MIYVRYIVSFLFIVLFGGVLFSFHLANLSNIPIPINATRTGFQTWHAEIHNFNLETWYTMLLFTAVLGIVLGIFMIVWSAKYETINVFTYNGEKTPSTAFNYLLACNNIITGIVAITLIIFDLGKFWTALGVIHNYFELVSMMLLHKGGNFTADDNILPWSFLYIVLAEGITILLNWPFDTVWFKFQGLSIDWAFIIQFTRLYIATKQNYKEGDSDVSLPQHVSDDDGREGESKEHKKKDGHNSHVFILPFAAFFHIVGNVLQTILSSEGIANYLFSFTYGFTFTAFAYFVYLDTHLKPNNPKKSIFVPDPSTHTVVLVTIASLLLSALCIRLGLFYITHT